MFKKIVSNLPFSPALVGQLGFYAKRLRKEDATRRLTLFFVVLALIIQSLAVFQPAESANASSLNDMVSGGLGSSLNNFLVPYDSNTKNLKDVMNYIGITREEIAAAKFTSWKVGEKLSWGYVSHFSYTQGERQYNIVDSDGKTVTTVYSRPLKLWHGTENVVNGWVGYSQAIGWFAFLQACGNLVTDVVPTPSKPILKTQETPAPTIKSEPKCTVNPSILASDENCKSCIGNETMWVNDLSCVPNIIKTKTSRNLSQGFIDASTVTAKPGDQISYTITIENTGLNSTSFKPMDNLSDVLEYATLLDNGGGTLDRTTGILSWPDIELKPKDIQTRTIVIKLLDSIPSTAQGSSNSTSFDCIITNTFGNSIGVKVDCPTPKTIEQVTAELPKTGPTENVIFACIILAIAGYFCARTRQLEREIRLVRNNVNTGTI